LAPAQRQRLAVDALAGTQPITRLAQDHDVSRKFVYQQAAKAQQALDQAFAPVRDDQRVLFYLPVTKALLRQIVLGLVLICHSSFRGVVAFLRDLFDYPLSVGTVANIVAAAVGPARRANEAQDLSGVRVGVHDEIYQAGQPVLVGACAHSTYCYLLSQEEECDADTWAVRLWEAQDRGLDPEATVGDGGTALRAGQGLAMTGVPCRGDVFHILYDWSKVLRQLESLAYAAVTKRLDLDRQLATPGKRRDRQKRSLQARRRLARAAEAKAVALYDDLALLRRWLREDILSLAGPPRPRVGPCSTSSWPKCRRGCRWARPVSRSCASRWRTSGRRCWRSSSRWTRAWPPWRGGSTSRSSWCVNCFGYKRGPRRARSGGSGTRSCGGSWAGVITP
jgi:hypothetical protein